MMNSKPAIRQQMRDRRNNLSPTEQTLAAKQLTQRMLTHPLFRAASSFAAYLPNDGEIDTRPLLRCAHRLGKQIYLPALSGTQLEFVRFRPGLTPLHSNAYDIAEPRPVPAALIDPRALDLVLLPLVAYDRCGRRLGMGGGYYDRTFAWRQRRGAGNVPTLLGLAHDFQCCGDLPEERWDIPLDALASERRVLLFKHKRKGWERIWSNKQ